MARASIRAASREQVAWPEGHWTHPVFTVVKLHNHNARPLLDRHPYALICSLLRKGDHDYAAQLISLEDSRDGNGEPEFVPRGTRRIRDEDIAHVVGRLTGIRDASCVLTIKRFEANLALQTAIAAKVALEEAKKEEAVFETQQMMCRVPTQMTSKGVRDGGCHYSQSRVTGSTARRMAALMREWGWTVQCYEDGALKKVKIARQQVLDYNVEALLKRKRGSWSYYEAHKHVITWNEDTLRLRMDFKVRLKVIAKKATLLRHLARDDLSPRDIERVLHASSRTLSTV